MVEYFDSMETRGPAVRERDLLRRLPRQLARSIANAPGWARHLAGIDPAAVTSRGALARLPLLRKPELKEMQAKDPPFAGFAIGGNGGFPTDQVSLLGLGALALVAGAAVARNARKTSTAPTTA